MRLIRQEWTLGSGSTLNSASSQVRENVRITKEEMMINKPEANLSGQFMSSPGSASAGVSDRVRRDILRSAASTARQQLERLAWRFGWRWPWAYALLLEIYRIVPRIRFALTTLLVDRDRELCAGPACHLERAECHPKCNRNLSHQREVRDAGDGRICCLQNTFPAPFP